MSNESLEEKWERKLQKNVLFLASIHRADKIMDTFKNLEFETTNHPPQDPVSLYYFLFLNLKRSFKMKTFFNDSEVIAAAEKYFID